MLFLSTLIAVYVASIVRADDNPPFPAPSKCSAQNTKSASSWQSCVTPATAYSSCDIDNQPCACSAYTLQQKCYSKYCPGDYPHTSDLEELCLSTAAATSDYFSNTFFHPSSESTRKATSKATSKATEAATPTDSVVSATSTSSSSKSTSKETGTTSATSATAGGASGGSTKSSSTTTPSAKPNAAARMVGISLGGVLAAMVAVLV